MNKKTRSVTLGGILIRIVFVIWTVAVLYPLIWAVLSSLKDNVEIFSSPWKLPSELHWENYLNAWVSARISTYFLNTVLVVGGTMLLLMLMSTTTAFVLSKYKFRGRNFVENLYVACMGIPMVLVLVPLYFIAQSMHLNNSLIGLIIIYPMMYLPFSILLMMGFFKSIPDSLIEAARLDGASEYKIFFKVMLPLVKSGLVIMAIVNILNYWNEYTYALTFLSDDTKYTLSIGISYLSASMQYRTDFGALFAGLVISMIPVLIIYAVFNKQLQEGMAVNSGVKG